MAREQLSTDRQVIRNKRQIGVVQQLRRHLFFRRSIFGILFVAPAMLFFLAFSIYPMVTGLIFKFYRFHIAEAAAFYWL